MLEFRDVRKRFNLEAGFFARVGRFVYAVNGVSFQLRDNEIYGLVGESGCGKTTTARLAVGSYPVDAGCIEFHSADGEVRRVDNAGSADLAQIRNRIKYVFQDPARALNPRMTIHDILTAGYRYTQAWPGRKQAAAEAAAILEEVGLSASDLDRRPVDFSGGQRQRISIARALIMKPEVLICDEVVSALDVSIQGQILNLLLRLKDQYRFSMLFIAHDLAVVTYICDRVGVMYRGVIVEEARSLDLVQKGIHPYTRHLYAGIPQLGKVPQEKGIGSIRFGEVPDPTEPPFSFQDVAPRYINVGEDHYVSEFLME
jgi:ABC-type oligopeptide transport system ATPase subunit